jgi:hypothetical protein
MAESFELVAFLCHQGGEAGDVCVAVSGGVCSGRCGVPVVAPLAKEAMMDPGAAGKGAMNCASMRAHHSRVAWPRSATRLSWGKRATE